MTPEAPAPFDIMLVEDSTLLLRELAIAFEALPGVHARVVAVACSEDEALRTLRRLPRPPDLLLVDVFLSAGSGLGVLRSAKMLDDRMRVAVLTNFATLDVRKRCLALGAERTFDKTAQLDALLDYVAGLARPAHASPSPA